MWKEDGFEEVEEEDMIILENEVTPPVYGNVLCTHSNDGKNLNEHLKTISTESGIWKEDRYIIGKRTEDDKQYCERVDPLDIHSTAEIRKYITAVEVFLSKKEDARSANEQQGRMLKYMLFFGLGMSVILWALYAGAISFPNI